MRMFVDLANQIRRHLWMSAGLVCLLTPTLDAASFMHVANGVWSSGFSSGGSLLPQNVQNTLDPHFSLIQLPAGCSGISCTQDGTTPFNNSTFVVNGPAPVFPFDGSWMANTSSSAWIGPRSDQGNPTVPNSNFPNVGIFANNNSPYVYRTLFNLGALGLNPLTAAIALAWQSDNFENSQIRLCSVATATDPVCDAAFAIAGSGNAGHNVALTNVNLQHGVNATFSSGWMALDFIVYNTEITSGRNPSGMRVQITSATADTADVPEPTTALLVGVALIAIGIRRRRQQ